MGLHPDVAARVAHLWGAHVLQLLSGEVEGVPPAGLLRRDDVQRRDAIVAGPGGPVPVRWYRSRSLAAEEPAPALVWVHGGGWRFGDLDMPEADSLAQIVAAGLPGAVVSVDYRLAPAHAHPAALDDVLAAFRSVVEEGRSGGVDPARVALGGGSAGGHLAALAAIELARAGEPPAALLLAYPVTDPVGGPYEDRHPDCPPVLWLGEEGTVGMFAAYVGADRVDDPAVVPAHCDLSGLPPTLVTTADVDSLRAQALRFVGLLDAAGVDVTHHDVDGLLHGYLNTVGDEPSADAALARHVAWLRARLDVGSGPGN